MINKSSFRGWLIEIVLYGLSVGFGMIWMSVAPLLPIISPVLHLSTEEAGLLTGLIPLCLAVGSLLSGFVGDHISLRATILLGGWMMGIFGLLSGTAPNYQMLLIYRLLAGLGSGFIFPNTACIVRQWFSPRRLAMLNAMNITAPAVGITLVLYSAPSIYSVIGWRPALFIYAAIPVFFAVFWSVIGKEKQQPSSMSVQRSSLLKTLLKKDTLLLSLNMFGANGAFSAFTTFLPSYLVNERAFTLAEAGVMTSTLTIAGIMFGFLGGVATGWVGLRKPFLWSSGILVVAGGISCVFPTGTLLLLALFSLGVGTTLGVGALFTVPSELGYSDDTARSMLSIIVFIGFIGAFVSPMMVGVMQMNDPSLSFKPGFLTVSLVASVTFFSGLLIKETGPRRTRKKPSP